MQRITLNIKMIFIHLNKSTDMSLLNAEVVVADGAPNTSEAHLHPSLHPALLSSRAAVTPLSSHAHTDGGLKRE